LKRKKDIYTGVPVLVCHLGPTQLNLSAISAERAKGCTSPFRLTEFDPAWVKDAHVGGKEEALGMFKTQPRTRFRDGNYDGRYLRTEQLSADNPEFISNIHRREYHDFASPRDDLDLRRTLAAHIWDKLDEMCNWPGFRAVSEVLRSSKDLYDADFAQEVKSAVAKTIAELTEQLARINPTGPDGQPLIPPNLKLVLCTTHGDVKNDCF
jgi:hypothetical protein